MKKKQSRILAAVILVAGLALTAGCGSSGGKGTEGALKGSISLSGSTSMEKMANALAEGFMEKYQGVTVTPEFTGSSAGIEAVTNGTVDIGDSSRALTEEEKAKGITENVVAIDGIAVITHKSNTVTKLTKSQLVELYTGKITNWKELGGQDEPVVVIGREAGSGTLDAFEELLEIKDKCAYSNQLDSTGAVLAKVGSTPGAIGYVSMDVLDDSVAVESIDGIAPSEETIKSGDYLLSRPFVMAIKGTMEEQNQLVKTFFEYLQSEEGQTLIRKTGLILPDKEQ